MKKNIFVISDLHLNRRFCLKKYNYLIKLFNKCDQLIVNGDLWSYYSFSFKDFINSKWNGLFPIMKEKECIFVYGNHDREEWCSKEVNLFSLQQYNSFKLDMPNYSIFIEHGHNIFGDSISNELFIKLHKTLQIDRVNYGLQDLFLKSFGYKRYSSFGKSINRVYKKEIIKRNLNNTFLLTGHTHCPEISLNEKFLNSGFIHGGYSSYILLNEQISLIEETY